MRGPYAEAYVRATGDDSVCFPVRRSGRTPIRHLDSSWIVAVLIGTLYSSVALVRLSAANWDPSVFIVAGDHFVQGDAAPAGLAILPESVGYDGQFFYRVALDPFSSATTLHGITLDIPSYRHQRIVYPALAWLLSFGQPELIPAMLILLNIIAAAALAWAGAALVRSAGLHALWGSVLALCPGFVLTLYRDLSELVAAAFVVGGLWMLRREKTATGSLLMTLAVLTKETTLLVVVGALLSMAYTTANGAAVPRRERYLLAVPLFVFAMWQGVLYAVWGELPVLAGGGNVGLPFAGFHAFLSKLNFTSSGDWLQLGAALVLVVTGVVTIRCLPRSGILPHERIAWILYLMLAATYTSLIWVEHWAFMRAHAEFSLLGALMVLLSGSRLRIPFAMGMLMLWLLVAWKA